MNLMNGNGYKNRLASLCVSVTIFLILALHSFRAYSKMVLHRMSMQSATTGVSCCVTMIGVDVESEMYHNDLRTVNGILIQFMGDCCRKIS